MFPKLRRTQSCWEESVKRSNYSYCSNWFSNWVFVGRERIHIHYWNSHRLKKRQGFKFVIKPSKYIVQENLEDHCTWHSTCLSYYTQDRFVVIPVFQTSLNDEQQASGLQLSGVNFFNVYNLPNAKFKIHANHLHVRTAVPIFLLKMHKMI